MKRVHSLVPCFGARIVMAQFSVSICVLQRLQSNKVDPRLQASFRQGGGAIVYLKNVGTGLVLGKKAGPGAQDGLGLAGKVPPGAGQHIVAAKVAAVWGLVMGMKTGAPTAAVIPTLAAPPVVVGQTLGCKECLYAEDDTNNTRQGAPSVLLRARPLALEPPTAPVRPLPITPCPPSPFPNPESS